MARPVVPKFGNWENEESVPYTVVFTNLRKNRGGKMINPNDPLEYPDMFPNMDPTPPAPPPSKPIRTRPNEPIGRGAVRPTPDHRVSTEDFDFRQSSNSPARSENIVQKSANESTHRNYGGRGARSNGPARQSAGSEYSIERSSNSPARSENIVQKSANESTHRNYGGRGARSNGPARQSAGSEYSIERSPLHPHYQAKVSGRGNGSFSLEGKNSYDSSHGTPGRSRLRPVTRGDETPDKSAAVPEFGIWNDDDPQSAKNFTQLFDDARKGRNMEPGNISGTPKLTSHNTPTHQYNKNQKKCCFPWF